jgi:hypothetical protein
MNQNFLTAVALCPGKKVIPVNNGKILELLDHFAEQHDSEYTAAAIVWYTCCATNRQEKWIDSKMKELETA